MKYFLICVSFVLFACAGGSDSEHYILEQEVKKSPTPKNTNELINAYSEWLSTHHEATKEKHDILLKSYDLCDQNDRYSEQVTILQMLVLDFPDDSKTMDRLIKMSQLMEQLKKNMAAHVLNQALVEKYGDQQVVKDQIATKLPPDQEPLTTMIDNLGAAMFNDSTLRLNARLGRQYVDACEAYATVFNGAAESAEFLHKAAETSRSLNTIKKALYLYDWIIYRYPDHARTPQALFLKAFTYDSDLGDVENARKYYQEFMTKYPEDEFAKSAQFLLENLGKDDEELLEILQKKQEAQ